MADAPAEQPPPPPPPPVATASPATPAAPSATAASAAAVAPPAAPTTAATPAAGGAAKPDSAAKPPEPPKPLVKQKPAPPAKSYLPAFAAPQAYGARGKALIAVQAEKKEVADKAAAVEEKKRKAKEAAKKKKKVKKRESREMTQEETEMCKMIFLIILGILVALSEALDLDVLIGILLMPFMSTMKWISVKFDNVSLDPQTWIDAIGNAYNHMCKESPGGFVGTDMVIWIIIFNLILFEADIKKWQQMQALKQGGYNELEEEPEGVEQGLTDESLERLFDDIDASGGGEIDRYACRRVEQCSRKREAIEPTAAGEPTHAPCLLPWPSLGWVGANRPALSACNRAPPTRSCWPTRAPALVSRVRHPGRTGRRWASPSRRSLASSTMRW